MVDGIRDAKSRRLQPVWGVYDAWRMVADTWERNKKGQWILTETNQGFA